MTQDFGHAPIAVALLPITIGILRKLVEKDLLSKAEVMELLAEAADSEFMPDVMGRHYTNRNNAGSTELTRDVLMGLFDNLPEQNRTAK